MNGYYLDMKGRMRVSESQYVGIGAQGPVLTYINDNDLNQRESSCNFH